MPPVDKTVMREPPDTSWIHMETIHSGGVHPFAVAVVGIDLLILMAAVMLLCH